MTLTVYFSFHLVYSREAEVESLLVVVVDAVAVLGAAVVAALALVVADDLVVVADVALRTAVVVGATNALAELAPACGEKLAEIQCRLHDLPFFVEETKAENERCIVLCDESSDKA